MERRDSWARASPPETSSSKKWPVSWRGWVAWSRSSPSGREVGKEDKDRAEEPEAIKDKEAGEDEVRKSKEAIKEEANQDQVEDPEEERRYSALWTFRIRYLAPKSSLSHLRHGYPGFQKTFANSGFFRGFEFGSALSAAL